MINIHKLEQSYIAKRTLFKSNFDSIAISKYCKEMSNIFLENMADEFDRLGVSEERRLLNSEHFISIMMQKLIDQIYGEYRNRCNLSKWEEIDRCAGVEHIKLLDTIKINIDEKIKNINNLEKLK